jgi:transcriptional regulator GlxA family with amidase domain
MTLVQNGALSVAVDPARYVRQTASSFSDLAPLACPAPRTRGGLPPRALKRVREFVEAHLEHNIRIQVLAEIVGLSVFHFARAFKQSEGVTPHAYLIQRRVRRVGELLANTNLPLSEIAMASGFSDQSHCTRRFRERVGVTPSNYRWALR